MKNIIILLGLMLALSSCVSTPPKFTGPTTASALLKSDTLEMIRLYNVAMTGCNSIDSVETEITSIPEDIQTNKNGVILKGSPTQERWTTMACGKKSVYLVKFMPDGKGGNYFSVTQAPPEKNQTPPSSK